MGAAVLLAMAAAAASSAAEDHHVRSVDARIQSFLRLGLEQSPTLRRLVVTLDQADVIVYLEPAMRRSQLGGYLSFNVILAGGKRYLRVKIVDRGTTAAIISTIAHEIQHAIEVAQAPEARDSQSIERLFSRLDEREQCGAGACYETTAARLIEAAVRDEIRAQGPLRRVGLAEALTTD